MYFGLFTFTFHNKIHQHSTSSLSSWINLDNMRFRNSFLNWIFLLCEFYFRSYLRMSSVRHIVCIIIIIDFFYLAILPRCVKSHRDDVIVIHIIHPCIALIAIAFPFPMCRVQHRLYQEIKICALLYVDKYIFIKCPSIQSPKCLPSTHVFNVWCCDMREDVRCKPDRMSSEQLSAGWVQSLYI